MRIELSADAQVPIVDGKADPMVAWLPAGRAAEWASGPGSPLWTEIAHAVVKADRMARGLLKRQGAPDWADGDMVEGFAASSWSDRAPEARARAEKELGLALARGLERMSGRWEAEKSAESERAARAAFVADADCGPEEARLRAAARGRFEELVAEKSDARAMEDPLERAAARWLALRACGLDGRWAGGGSEWPPGLDFAALGEPTGPEAESAWKAARAMLSESRRGRAAPGMPGEEGSGERFGSYRWSRNGGAGGPRASWPRRWTRS